VNLTKAARLMPGPLGGGGLVGLWGASGLIASVQYGTIAIGGAGTSGTATITAVNTANAVLVDLRQSNNWSGGTDPQYVSTSLALTNSTTVTASRYASGGISATAAFAVIEFRPGVLKSVQYGSVSLAAATSATATITAVNPATTILLSLGITGDPTARADYFYSYLTLTNSTTVTATRASGGGTSITHAFAAVEFF
jgi:hypothetical protein